MKHSRWGCIYRPKRLILTCEQYQWQTAFLRHSDIMPIWVSSVIFNTHAWKICIHFVSFNFKFAIYPFFLTPFFIIYFGIPPSSHNFLNVNLCFILIKFGMTEALGMVMKTRWAVLDIVSLPFFNFCFTFTNAAHKHWC
jgi:hypothetical protein